MSDKSEVMLSVRPAVHIRRKRFIDEYVRNNGNGVQAALAAGFNSPERRRGGKSTPEKVAGVTASQLLAIPSVRAEIISAFEKRGLTMDVVLDAHHRNITQSTSLSTSQKAISDYYRIAGLEARGTKVSVKFNITE